MSTVHAVLLLLFVGLCSVIPYVDGKQRKLLPLSVVVNAAGLLSNATLSSLRPSFPTEAQCQYLNELCATAALDFTFDTTTTSLVAVSTMYAVAKPTPYVRVLPRHDPFSHAQFIDEGVLGHSSSTSPVQSGTSVAPLSVVDAESVGLTVSQPALSTLPPSQVSSISRTLPFFFSVIEQPSGQHFNHACK